MTDLNRILDLTSIGEHAAMRDMRLPNPAWAWEYLRRNPDYRSDYQELDVEQTERIHLASGCFVIPERLGSSDAAKWGLLRYSDPDKCSAEANVFWRPDLLAGALGIKLHPLEPKLSGVAVNQDEIVLDHIEANRVLFQSSDGALHILINGAYFWIQLYCKRPKALIENARIGVEIDGVKHFQRRLDTAKQLLSLYQSSGRDLSLIGRTKPSKRLTYGLVALDIIAAGGTHKDVALCTLGANKVEQDWGTPGHYLEDWTRKLIARANALSQGGYRRFLTKKSL